MQLTLIGLALPFLTACVPRWNVIEKCPPIPVVLTEVCTPAARAIETNADLARAYIDALECVDEQNLKLRTIAALSC